MSSRQNDLKYQDMRKPPSLMEYMKIPIIVIILVGIPVFIGYVMFGHDSAFIAFLMISGLFVFASVFYYFQSLQHYRWEY